MVEEELRSREGEFKRRYAVAALFGQWFVPRFVALTDIDA